MKGLGAVLLQKGRPVIYVSRTLTPAEERYSNIERELLGVVFAIWGDYITMFMASQFEFKQITNLETIWKKSIVTASPEASKTTAETGKIRNPARVH